MNQSPSAFLEQLLDAHLLYTPIDPEDLPNLKAFNLAFVAQSAPDMRTKIQKTDVFAGKNRSELLEISQKGFDDKDSKDLLVNEMGVLPWLHYKPQPSTLPMHTMIKGGDLY